MASSSLIRTLLLFLLLIPLLACDRSQPQDSEGNGKSVQMQEMDLANALHPESSTRLLRPDELEGRTPFQLKIMRNEILARHGYIFKTPEMIDYFSKQSWYEEDPEFNEKDLSKIELENIALIQNFEKNQPTGFTIDGDDGKHKVVSTSVSAKAVVDSWARQYALQEGHQIYAKKTFPVDYDSDGDVDAIGVCALGGGGSGYHQYIAAFENRNGVLQFVSSGDAGGSGSWTVDKLIGGGNKSITMSTDVWLEDDGHCCPNGKGEVVYTISGEILQPEWIDD